MNFSKVQRRKGIGTVITTLIVLIASVVLGAGVIFFGGSLFQTNTQSEAVKVSNVHSWVNSADVSATAFVVQNTGSKAVTINTISLRGVSVPTTAWAYLQTTNQTILQTELPVEYVHDTVTLGGTLQTMTQDGPISLNQGQAAVVYLLEAGSINAVDSGLSLTLQIQAGQATAVQSVSVVSAESAS